MDFGLGLWATVAAEGSFWTIFWRVFLVVLGINAVIIVHEWGHFIVARMCGVRCDKFYIWFDAWGFKFFSFKWGNTEYGLGWLPLGGYVKMYGQEDNPGAIKKEVESAKLTQQNQEVSDSNSNEARKEGETSLSSEQLVDLEKTLYAPDSYLSKNVLQRMAIISAGVFMNVVFAIFCGALAGYLGVPEISSQISQVVPGSPAWEAGLEAGDTIVEINGKSTQLFSDVQIGVIDGKETTLKVLKPGQSEPVSLTICPKLQKGGMTPTIGVLPIRSLSLNPYGLPYYPSITQAENQRLDSIFDGLKSNDRLVSMNGEPVNNGADYERLVLKYIDKPIRYEFATSDEKVGQKASEASSPQNFSLELPPRGLSELGIRLTMGEITAIQKGSLAEKIGLKKQERDENQQITQHGDILYALNNEPILDPVKLPYQILAMSGALADLPGTPTSLVLTVLRDGQPLDFPVSLPQKAGYTGSFANQNQLAIGHLGVTYEVLPIVSGIESRVQCDSDSYAGRIQRVLVDIPRPDKESDERLQTNYDEFKQHREILEDGRIAFVLDGDADSVVNSWLGLASLLPFGTPVEVEVVQDDGTVQKLQTVIEESKDTFRQERGLCFGMADQMMKTRSLGKALSFGWKKTLDSMTVLFKVLPRMGSTVSAKAMGGPVSIVRMAYQTTQSHDGMFFIFLCMIGANLAVINFLPIPVLDGGHIVFLLYEAIFRRPPNERIQIILSFIGLFLILALMFWVLFLDFARLLGFM